MTHTQISVASLKRDLALTTLQAGRAINDLLKNGLIGDAQPNGVHLVVL